MAKEHRVKLIFTCPECGGHNVSSNEVSEERYYVSEVIDDPDSPVFYHDKSDVLDHYKTGFCCTECNFELRTSCGKVADEQELVQWIKQNCPQ